MYPCKTCKRLTPTHAVLQERIDSCQQPSPQLQLTLAQLYLSHGQVYQACDALKSLQGELSHKPALVRPLPTFFSHNPALVGALSKLLSLRYFCQEVTKKVVNKVSWRVLQLLCSSCKWNVQVHVLAALLFSSNRKLLSRG